MRRWLRRMIGASGPGRRSRAGAEIATSSGRVAIVTGGSGVVGSAICRALVRDGVAVAIVYATQDARARALGDELTAIGGRVLPIRADIRREADVASMAAAVAGELGPVDILVNNAAPSGVPRVSFLEHSWNDYVAHLETILKGSVLCARAVLPGMVERRFGRIINIGSTALERINAQMNPYAAAKGSLLGFTRSLAEEFGPFGITANQVVPGLMWTHDRDPRPGEADLFRSQSPLHPGVARPEHVADVVAFVASERAAMITGASIPVAAGQVRT